MKKIVLILVASFVIVVSCQRENPILNSDFKKVLENYVKNNPVNNKEDNHLFDKQVPKQLYQVFFDKRKDTFVAIKLVPHLVPFNVIEFESKKDSLDLVVEKDYKGYFLINGEPVVIFDENNYSKNLILEDKLKYPLPDDYIFNINKINNHVNSMSAFYKLKKGTLEEISLEYLNNVEN